MDGLDDILNDTKPETEAAAIETDAPEPVSPPEPSAASQPRDDSGRFAPKGEQEASHVEAGAPPAPEAPSTVPVNALVDERRKRREAEAQLREFQARFGAPAPAFAPQAAPTAEPALIPSVFDDENAFAVQLLETARREVAAELMPQFRLQLEELRIDSRREALRREHADFEQVETQYFELIQRNPALAAEVARQPDPVGYAYQVTKNFLEVQRAGSTDLAALRAQIRAELEAELAAKSAPAASLPSTLAGEQSARSSATAPQAPPSLEAILSRA